MYYNSGLLCPPKPHSLVGHVSETRLVDMKDPVGSLVLDSMSRQGPQWNFSAQVQSEEAKDSHLLSPTPVCHDLLTDWVGLTGPSSLLESSSSSTGPKSK